MSGVNAMVCSNAAAVVAAAMRAWRCETAPFKTHVLATASPMPGIAERGMLDGIGNQPVLEPLSSGITRRDGREADGSGTPLRAWVRLTSSASQARTAPRATPTQGRYQKDHRCGGASFREPRDMEWLQRMTMTVGRGIFSNTTSFAVASWFHVAFGAFVAEAKLSAVSSFVAPMKVPPAE